jgi:hypothetical protein
MSPLVSATFAFSWLMLVSMYFWQRRRWQVALARQSGPAGTPRAMGKLIDVCIDDEGMLEHEGRSVHGHRRAVLGQLAAERSGLVGRLTALGYVRGRSRRVSWIELGRELGRSLRSRLGGPNDGDSVAACRRSCRRAEIRFDAALELSWPEHTRSTLVHERACLGVARDALIAIEY